MNFILSEFNEEKIRAINDYTKHTYNRGSIIYGSNKFCDAMINSVLPINNTEATNIEAGYIGVYYGNEVYCIPELQDTMGIVMPKLK